MLLTNDITNFMQWWLNQVWNIFTQVYSILESIEFMNTNLLEVIIAVIIISIILRIFLSISKSSVGVIERNSKK